MTATQKGSSLARSAGVDEKLTLDSSTEAAWIEVIQKMEQVYADLVHTQVQVEENNAALEEAQQFIRSVLMSMTDVLVVCDLQGNIQQVNRALEDLTGRPDSELRGQSLYSLFSEDSLPQVTRFRQRVGKNAIVDCEVSILDQKGGAVPLAINCSDRYDHDGGLVGMVLIGRPVGELQRAYKDLNQTHEELQQTQQQLVQSEKMASLGRLVAGVAHELNNPISFVFGNMHALQSYGERMTQYMSAVDEDLDRVALRELRDKLKIGHIMDDMASLIDGTLEGAERVRDIVQDLRRYSASQKESASDFDLSEIIQTAVQWVIKASRVKPDITYDIPETLMITGRKGHAHQILMNLVQNAMDIMEGQVPPRLTISCHPVGPLVEVRLHDAGPGIPEDSFTKIFDPFYTTKPVGKGTGLGLSISYGLAISLGGDLTVENHIDGGAVFTLSLPIRGKSNE